MAHDKKALEEEFYRGCIDGYRICAKELGYRATYFLQMVQEHGGVQAAKLLLQTKEPSEGLMRLWEEGRLDLSLENYVLAPRFLSLFTETELWVARQRLKQLDYTPNW